MPEYSRKALSIKLQYAAAIFTTPAFTSVSKRCVLKFCGWENKRTGSDQPLDDLGVGSEKGKKKDPDTIVNNIIKTKKNDLFFIIKKLFI
jgi:hypothetical protein